MNAARRHITDSYTAPYNPWEIAPFPTADRAAPRLQITARPLPDHHSLPSIKRTASLFFPPAIFSFYSIFLPYIL